jgi:hypothetical protein
VPTSRRAAGDAPLSVDEALIALFIGAMDANQHVAREELARAHHLIWSANQYRRKSGETVGRLIDRMKRLVEERGAAPVMERAMRAIPARLRPSAYALVADLLLSDGKIDRRERRFLEGLADGLRLDAGVAASLVEAMLVKNKL